MDNQPDAGTAPPQRSGEPAGTPCGVPAGKLAQRGLRRDRGRGPFRTRHALRPAGGTAAQYSQHACRLCLPLHRHQGTLFRLAEDAGFLRLGHAGHDATYESIARTVEEARQELGGPLVEVEIKLEPGRPAQVVLEASADACLLVVGSKGSGAWGASPRVPRAPRSCRTHTFQSSCPRGHKRNQPDARQRPAACHGFQTHRHVA